LYLIFALIVAYLSYANIHWRTLSCTWSENLSIVCRSFWKILAFFFFHITHIVAAHGLRRWFSHASVHTSRIDWIPCEFLIVDLWTTCVVYVHSWNRHTSVSDALEQRQHNRVADHPLFGDYPQCWVGHVVRAIRRFSLC
jgi:hypothetical protein